MESQPPSQLQTLKNNRVANLQKMLQDQKRQLLRKVHRYSQSLLVSKKYKHYRNVMQQRVNMADNFIKHASDSFFTMLDDKEFLMITTEIDVIQKVQKFKKNILNSLQKITQNLQSSTPLKTSTYPQQKTNQKTQKQVQPDSSQQYQQSKPKRRSVRCRNKSKNFKISNDATRAMMEWLLKNFQNPYPTTEEKQQMSKQGGISMMKVNNWFINARERTVKGYFQKDI